MSAGRTATWLAVTFASALPLRTGLVRAIPVEQSIATTLTSSTGSEPGRWRLPTTLDLAWQARLQGSVTYPPAVSTAGELVVASSGGLSQLAASGNLAWSYRVRGASVAARPVILPSGHRILITSRSELFVLDPRGQLTARSIVAVPAGSQLVGPIGTPESTIALAFGSSVLLLDVNGKALATTAASGPVSNLTVFHEQVWVTTREGHVERWIPGVGMQRAGELGGTPSAIEFELPTRLIGIVDQSRLIELDLTSGRRRVLADDDTVTFSGQPMVDRAAGTVLATTAEGLMISYDSTGTETRRVLLSPVASTKAPVTGSTQISVGARGSVLFVLPTGELGVVQADGSVSRARATACPAPVAVVSTGTDRLAVACGSGLIMGYRAKSESPEGTGELAP